MVNYHIEIHKMQHFCSIFTCSLIPHINQSEQCHLKQKSSEDDCTLVNQVKRVIVVGWIYLIDPRVIGSFHRTWDLSLHLLGLKKKCNHEGSIICFRCMLSSTHNWWDPPTISGRKYTRYYLVIMKGIWRENCPESSIWVRSLIGLAQRIRPYCDHQSFEGILLSLRPLGWSRLRGWFFSRNNRVWSNCTARQVRPWSIYGNIHQWNLIDCYMLHS